MRKRRKRRIGIGQRNAISAVNYRVQEGLIRPATDFACVDCGKPATAYDHRDYAKPLDVEPVCHSCNRARGSAENNDQPYSNGIEFHCGQRYNGLSGDPTKESKLDQDLPSGGGPDFPDEHWVTHDDDWGYRKAVQEMSRLTAKRDYFSTSFLRGLYDWYGVEPL